MDFCVKKNVPQHNNSSCSTQVYRLKRNSGCVRKKKYSDLSIYQDRSLKITDFYKPVKTIPNIINNFDRTDNISNCDKVKDTLHTIGVYKGKSRIDDKKNEGNSKERLHFQKLEKLFKDKYKQLKMLDILKNDTGLEREKTSEIVETGVKDCEKPIEFNKNYVATNKPGASFDENENKNTEILLDDSVGKTGLQQCKTSKLEKCNNLEGGVPGPKISFEEILANIKVSDVKNQPQPENNNVNDGKIRSKGKNCQHAGSPSCSEIKTADIRNKNRINMRRSFKKSNSHLLRSENLQNTNHMDSEQKKLGRNMVGFDEFLNKQTIVADNLQSTNYKTQISKSQNNLTKADSFEEFVNKVKKQMDTISEKMKINNVNHNTAHNKDRAYEPENSSSSPLSRSFEEFYENIVSLKANNLHGVYNNLRDEVSQKVNQFERNKILSTKPDLVTENSETGHAVYSQFASGLDKNVLNPKNALTNMNNSSNIDLKYQSANSFKTDNALSKRLSSHNEISTSSVRQHNIFNIKLNKQSEKLCEVPQMFTDRNMSQNKSGVRSNDHNSHTVSSSPGHQTKYVNCLSKRESDCHAIVNNLSFDEFIKQFSNTSSIVRKENKGNARGINRDTIIRKKTTDYFYDSQGNYTSEEVSESYITSKNNITNTEYLNYYNKNRRNLNDSHNVNSDATCFDIDKNNKQYAIENVLARDETNRKSNSKRKIDSPVNSNKCKINNNTCISNSPNIKHHMEKNTSEFPIEKQLNITSENLKLPSCQQNVISNKQGNSEEKEENRQNESNTSLLCKRFSGKDISQNDICNIQENNSSRISRVKCSPEVALTKETDKTISSLCGMKEIFVKPNKFNAKSLNLKTNIIPAPVIFTTAFSEESNSEAYKTLLESLNRVNSSCQKQCETQEQSSLEFLSQLFGMQNTDKSNEEEYSEKQLLQRLAAQTSIQRSGANVTDKDYRVEDIVLPADDNAAMNNESRNSASERPSEQISNTTTTFDGRQSLDFLANKENKDIADLLLEKTFESVSVANMRKCFKVKPQNVLKEVSQIQHKPFIKKCRKGKVKLYRIKRKRKTDIVKEPENSEKVSDFDTLYEQLTQTVHEPETDARPESTTTLGVISSISLPSSFITDDSKSETLSTGSAELTLAQQRLRNGFNEISKNKNLLWSREDLCEMPNRADKNEIKRKIQEIFLKVHQEFSDSKIPYLKLRRQSFDNCSFVNNRLELNKKGNVIMVRVSYGAQKSKLKFCLMMFILGKIRDLLENGTKLTKREIYYQIKNYINDQRHVDRAVNAISCMLAVGQWDLNIVAQKGLVYGDLKIVMASNETLNCNIPGTLIPQDIDEIIQVQSSAYFILVVEKESIFHKLIEEDLPNKLTRPFIMITGKGFPDLNTQLFLKKLWMLMSVPVFILVDADPHGVNIMINYRFGSLSNSHVSNQLAVPKAQWLGVFPSEITSLNIERTPLNTNEQNMIKQLLKTPYMNGNPRIAQELNTMLDRNYKAEIEGLIKSNTFLSEAYLPNKFYQHNYF